MPTIVLNVIETFSTYTYQDCLQYLYFKNTMALNNNNVKNLIKILQVIRDDSYIQARLPNYMKSMVHTKLKYTALV